jgi:hypothetical protein
VPAAQTGGRIARGMSSASRISSDHARAVTSKSIDSQAFDSSTDARAAELVADPVVQHEQRRHVARVVVLPEPEIPRAAERCTAARGP